MSETTTELVECEECSSRYRADEGCPHDHHYCPAGCLLACPTCRADIRDDLAGEGL